MLSATLRFTITRGCDDALQWSPPVGSRELANALSYHYPFQETLLEKMQQAMEDFFKSEGSPSQCTSPYCFSDSNDKVDSPAWNASFTPFQLTVSPKSDVQVSVAARRGASTPAEPQRILSLDVPNNAFRTWKLDTGEIVTGKRRRRLDPAERQIVTENRGNTCTRHRRSKTRVCIEMQYLVEMIYALTSCEHSVIRTHAPIISFTAKE
jgi:hypothetical protein